MSDFEVKRLKIIITEDELNEIESYFYKTGKAPLYKDYKIRDNDIEYIVKIKEITAFGRIAVNIYEITDRGNRAIFNTILKGKYDLYKPFFMSLGNLEVYFRIDVIPNPKLDNVCTYVLNRIDSVNSTYDMMNLLGYSNFNNEFELVEFCTLILLTTEINTHIFIETALDKLSYYGYDEDLIDEALSKLVNDFKNVDKLNWHKISSKEFADMIVKFTFIELLHKQLTLSLDKNEMKLIISSLYGMYIYSLFYENKKKV